MKTKPDLFKVVCGWCQQLKGYTLNGAPLPQNHAAKLAALYGLTLDTVEVSHGICQGCADTLKADARKRQVVA